MKNIIFFLSENFQFLVVKCSLYLNRRVFVMEGTFSDVVAHKWSWRPSWTTPTPNSIRKLEIFCAKDSFFAG